MMRACCWRSAPGYFSCSRALVYERFNNTRCSVTQCLLARYLLLHSIASGDIYQYSRLYIIANLPATISSSPPAHKRTHANTQSHTQSRRLSHVSLHVRGNAVGWFYGGFFSCCCYILRVVMRHSPTTAFESPARELEKTCFMTPVVVHAFTTTTTAAQR